MSLLISKLDFLGRKDFLTMNGSKMHKSFFGGILSLLTIIISTVASCYFIYLMFSRTSYNVIVSDEYNNKPFKNWTILVLSIFVTDILGWKINDSDKYFEITSNLVQNKPVPDNNGTFSFSLNYTDIFIEYCSMNEHFQEN